MTDYRDPDGPEDDEYVALGDAFTWWVLALLMVLAIMAVVAAPFSPS